jgi:hypothetical protein
VPVLWFLFHEEWLRPSASHLGSWRWVVVFLHGAAFKVYTCLLYLGVQEEEATSLCPLKLDFFSTSVS